jgi:hypothetical protein
MRHLSHRDADQVRQVSQGPRRMRHLSHLRRLSIRPSIRRAVQMQQMAAPRSARRDNRFRQINKSAARLSRRTRDFTNA